MANQINSQELKGWDKVVAWYARQSYAVNMIYSLGASVVIIGALFKILHWPGASYVLMVGMFTEAFLFMLGIFEKPHASYHWENVFPQLIGHEEKELVGGNGSTQGLMPQAEVLPEAELKALKEGIQNLGKTAQQLASIGEVAEATGMLKSSMTQAAEAVTTVANDMLKSNQSITEQYEQLGKTYQSVVAEMDGVLNGAKVYGKELETINTNIASLNSVYELQLKELNAQSDAFRTQTERVNAVSAVIEKMATEVKTMQDSTVQAAEAGKQYQTAQQKLAQQVADLNKVYGNMLNALA